MPDARKRAPVGRRGFEDLEPERTESWDEHRVLLIRQVYTAPGSNDLVAVASKARVFPSKMMDVLKLRDDVCRMPFCNNRIKEADHVVGYAEGGATTLVNGQGLCRSCNLAKALAGWTSKPLPRHEHDVCPPIMIQTPDGHTYTSTPPPLPGIYRNSAGDRDGDGGAGSGTPDDTAGDGRGAGNGMACNGRPNDGAAGNSGPDGDDASDDAA